MGVQPQIKINYSTESDEDKTESIKKICQQEKRESKISKLAITGYKNHTCASRMGVTLPGPGGGGGF